VIGKNKLARKDGPDIIEKPRSDCGTPSGNQVRDHGDHGKNQKQMNQAAGYVKSREPENPNDE
jgi:hypothetical protein